MKGSFRGFFGWLYRKLSSLRVSVYLLGLLSFLFIIGTIFPQGAGLPDYEKTGGRFLSGVKFFNLLDVFNTPWFLFPASVFFLNILICTYDRFSVIRKRRKSIPETFPPTEKIPLSLGIAEAGELVPAILRKKLGFRVLSENTPWTALEKGISYRWLTWLYHAAIAISFLGFIISGLFVEEGVLRLRRNEPVEIVSTEPENLGWLVKKDHAPASFKLALDDFITEYTELPELEYPKDKLSRLAIFLGWKNLSYRMEEESFFPKDWFSRLRVLKDGRTVYEKTIEVNDPLRFEGYTFYQAAYEQSLKLKLKDEIIEVTAYDAVALPALGEKLLFGTLRNGTLFRKNGASEKIRPFTIVKKMVKTTDGKEKEETLGKLEVGGHITVNGKKLMLVDFAEDSVLSYRYDPGARLLFIAGSFVFIVMALRCFGGYYMLAYSIEGEGGGCSISLYIREKGLSADKERIIRRLKHHLADHSRQTFI